MFTIQSKKYFPLPEYELSNDSVKVTIEGKVLDMNYALKLATIPNLTLQEIILLDKVQKGHDISAEEVKTLKGKNLIEGKRPNLHISSNVAKYTNQEDEYLKLKGINDDYAKKMMIEYLKITKKAKKADFIKALLEKLPDILTVEQKQNKIKNYLQELRRDGLIVNTGKYWETAKN
jgi:ATP-dependent DNA helicase RecG